MSYLLNLVECKVCRTQELNDGLLIVALKDFLSSRLLGIDLLESLVELEYILVEVLSVHIEELILCLVLWNQVESKHHWSLVVLESYIVSLDCGYFIAIKDILKGLEFLMRVSRCKDCWVVRLRFFLTMMRCISLAVAWWHVLLMHASFFILGWLAEFDLNLIWNLMSNEGRTWQATLQLLLASSQLWVGTLSHSTEWTGWCSCFLLLLHYNCSKFYCTFFIILGQSENVMRHGINA